MTVRTNEIVPVTGETVLVNDRFRVTGDAVQELVDGEWVALGGGGAALPYRSYVAELRLDDNFISATEIHNDLGVSIAWTRGGTGYYRGTPSSSINDFVGRHTAFVNVKRWDTGVAPTAFLFSACIDPNEMTMLPDMSFGNPIVLRAFSASSVVGPSEPLYNLRISFELRIYPTP
jgi:hypothetical protein